MNMRFKAKLIAFTTMFSCSLVSVICEGSPASAEVQGKYREPIDTCADLQKIANRISKQKGRNITLHGFENIPMRTDVYMSKPKGTDRLCQLGYLTSISPMGKKICRAHIYTNTESSRLSWSIGYFRTTFYDPVNYESEFCRWL